MNTQNISQNANAIHSYAVISRHASPSTRARRLLSAMLMSLTIAVCVARNSTAQQVAATASDTGGAASQALMHILIPAPLASSLDSKKLKAGDEVILKTTAKLSLKDGSTIPRGTKVVGHVTEAKARSRGDTQSSLAITFDKLDLPDGTTMTISGVIRAIGPDLRDAPTTGGGVDYTDLRGATFAPTVGIPGRSVPQLNEESVGVVGIKDLQLAADGMLSSDSKSVKLESGSQVLLQVQLSKRG
jgi:hypothetical protein